MSTELATALSQVKGSFAAGEQAARQAFSRLQGGRADLCLVFGSPTHDMAEVVKGIRTVVGPATQIMGASSCGEFTEQTISKGSLAVGLIYSDDYSFQVRAATGLREDVVAVMAGLRAEFDDFLQREGQTSIILLIDGLAGNGEEATLATSAAFGTDAKIAGGAAGDELAFQETWVVANDQVLTNAACLCLAKGPGPFFTGVQHGHEPLSETLEVTQAEGSILYTIDGRSAWDVWKDKTRDHARTIGIDVDQLATASEEGIFLIRFELGLETDGGYKIRVPLSRNEDGSLNFACTIPQGVKFRIMKSRKDEQILSARAAAQRAVDEAGGQAIAGALVFDCVCRSIILEEQFGEAIEAIGETVGDVPLVGFETYGEICMDPSQFSGFHNTTSVVVLIPR